MRYLFIPVLALFFVSCSIFSSSSHPLLPFTQGRVGGGDASRRFVELTGASKHIGTLVWPVRLAKVSSRYGVRNGRFHSGIDIYKPRGTPVIASHTGKVIYSADSGTGYGLMIVIQNDELATAYAHNDENLVKVGEKVTQGDQIGTVGDSGNATGPHVHFEVRVKGQDGKMLTVDPSVFFGSDPLTERG